MSQYILRRFLLAIPTLLMISFVLFAILALAPGDPMSQFALNPSVTAGCARNMKRALGLDQPWPVRYVKWLTAAAQGNLGYSFAAKIPVTTLITQRLPQTLSVVGSAFLLAVLLAIPIGVISAVRQYSIFDQVGTFFSFIGFSVPSFFTGLLLMLVFAVSLGWVASRISSHTTAH